MVSKKLLMVLVSLSLILIFSFESVSAVVTIISPANYTNHTGTAVFNVSYVNGTDFTGAVNATFYYNLSGTWTSIGVGICNNGATASSCNGTLTISGLTDGVYSINATLANNTANGAGYGAVVLTHNVIFDSTAPNVSGYFTSVNRGNYSGVINLNASVNDATIGIDSVYFNITHSNGTQVNWTKGSVSGGYYNVTINTSSFTDGVYNITAYANDSLNNLNKTEMISITIDNTNPGVSFSCSSSSLTAGNSLTCSCSGSDTTSGVQTTSYTANPSTSDTGTYTQTCTVTDYSGNSASSTFTYTISSLGGGTTSTTSSDYTKTIPQNQEEFSEIKEVNYNLKSKERVKLKINDEEHYVGVTEVNGNSATVEVFSTSQKAVFNIGEEKKFEVTGDDYYDLKVKLNSIENSKANITIISIQEQIVFEGENEEVIAEPEEIEPNQEKGNGFIWFFVIGIIVVIGIVAYIMFNKNNFRKGKKR